MATLQNYKDTGSQCWAGLTTQNNEPIWIGVAQTGVVVKKSKIGLMGAKLFSSRDVIHAATVAQNLDEELYDTQLPDDCEITNAVLGAFVKAAIASDTLQELCSKIAGADK
ncbi:hypothetical protein OAG38_05775 [Akkermansiaceae bacterium]|nr:hypothetical protein [Akkermansiaceae bacterium]